MKEALSEVAPASPKVWRVGTLVYTQSGLAVLFAWLLWGDFAWSIRDRTVGTVLQLILRKYEVSDTVAGLLMGTLPAAVGLIVNPIVSFRSDRHRSPRGRRIPFLLASAPLAALSIIGLGLSPMLGRLLHEALGTHSPGYYGSVIVVLALWWALFDVATTVTNAVFGALINDVVPGPVMGRFYGLFRIVSLLVGIVFNGWLLDRAEAHFVWLFLLVGAVYGIGVVSMCLKVREGDYPPPAASGERVGLAGFPGAVRAFFRQSFTHPYYLWFFLAMNLGVLAFLPVNLYLVFFAKSLNIDTGTYGIYMAVTLGISLFLAYFLGALADRIHPLRIGMAVVGLYAALALWGACFVSSRTTFAVAMLGHCVLSGAYYTGTASLAQRILPAPLFAQLSSAAGIVGATFFMILPWCAGRILDGAGHDYRLTYWMGFAVALAALGCLAEVYRRWRKYGGAAGDEKYVAPLWEA